MAARVGTMNEPDQCELCGYRSDGTFRDRVTHLRGSHPAYARGLLLRVASPLLFLVELGILAALKAPQWAYLVALFSSFGLLFFGKQRSRSERHKAGARPTLPIKRLVREGGLGFLLILPVIAILIVALGRK